MKISRVTGICFIIILVLLIGFGLVFYFLSKPRTGMENKPTSAPTEVPNAPKITPIPEEIIKEYSPPAENSPTPIPEEILKLYKTPAENSPTPIPEEILKLYKTPVK